MLGTIASLLGVIFKDEIGELWFEQTTLRRYIATNFKAHVLKPEAERALKPGDPPFRECAKDCPEMVVLPAGSFWMGSPNSEARAQPERRSRSHGDDRRNPSPSASSRSPGTTGRPVLRCGAATVGQPATAAWERASIPVINVSWDQAKAYVAWLSRMTGKPYRLLTEAEWEYAARGVTSADAPHPPYPWGDQASHEYANYGTDQCCNGRVEGRDQWFYTAPVGQFPPNAFGLHDMHGNVWEWVEDPWHDDYRGAPIDGSAWTEGGDASRRVVRGGSWNYDPEDLRSAVRIGYPTDFRLNVLGFRVGRTLTP